MQWLLTVDDAVVHVISLHGSEQEQLPGTLSNPVSVGGRLMLEDFKFKLGRSPIVLLKPFVK